MIDNYLPNLPYELIGKVVVALVLLVAALVALAVLILGVLFVWVRFWRRVSNRMHKGYEINSKEKRPPVWKLRISGVALALSRFQFRKVIPAYREAETLTENDSTVRQYLKNVFIDS